MVSTYMKQCTPSEGGITLNINNLKNSNQDLTQGQSDLIYNLSDVRKFLPNINEYENFGEKCSEMFTRKRKERQDSENLSSHECKLIRSNSEERTVEEKITSDDNIRRVSSHEDFEKCRKPTCNSHLLPLQTHLENNLPLRTRHNNLPSSNENIYLKDWGKTESVGEKYSKLFSQDADNENVIEFHGMRQKYLKNDSSPLRSSIHEYILFPKRISPNRDPNAIGVRRIYDEDYQDVERDTEKARSCERRSRARRVPQRRLPKNYVSQDKSLMTNRNSHMTPLKFDVERKSPSDDHTVPKCGSFVSDELKKSEEFENTNKNNIFNPHLSKVILKNRDRSQSPDVHSDSPLRKHSSIDLSKLHEHLGQHEPMPSISLKYSDVLIENDSQNLTEYEPLLDCNIVGYSRDISELPNRNTICSGQTDFVDSQALCGTNIMEPDEKLQKISKKIQNLKKKISKYEIDFESNHGYRASHADKMNDSSFRKLYVELRRLKNERKTIKRGPSDFMLKQMQLSSEEQLLKNKPMAEIMAEIEKRLETKRWAHGRPSELENCSRAQLVEEKIAVQRALLWLEGARGRPTLQTDRDSARPLYDRYRTVKRLVAGFDSMKLNSGNVGELATILEHEALPTMESPVESPESGDKTSYSETDSPLNSSDNNDGDAGASSSTISDKPVLSDEKQDIINENLHCLSLSELNKLLLDAKNAKTSLRIKIKEMEVNYEDRINRKSIKDDKNLIMPIYAKYKETKARIRLLTALVNKQKKSNG